MKDDDNLVGTPCISHIFDSNTINIDQTNNLAITGWNVMNPHDIT